MSRGIIVHLISPTRPTQETKTKVENETVRTIAPANDPFHKEWNYQIQPKTSH
jgi:hypothetical protein